MDYIPYGDEWIEEMTKLPKDTILKMFSKMGIEKQQEISQLRKESEAKEEWLKENPPFSGPYTVEKSSLELITENRDHLRRLVIEANYTIKELQDKEISNKMKLEEIREIALSGYVSDGWLRVLEVINKP